MSYGKIILEAFHPYFMVVPGHSVRARGWTVNARKRVVRLKTGCLPRYQLL